MSLHKLTAGDGYTYLSRQVAAHDETARGRDGLASYYAERGESLGVWLGSAATGEHGLPAAGAPVVEAQMVALFGEGRHPDADRIEAEQVAQGASVRAALAASQLGRPYRTEGATSVFRVRLAARFREHDTAAGRPAGAALDDDIRARLRTGLAREMFAEEHGRAPVDARELSGFLARVSRPAAGPVAGYDLTFTPVKSVSALWAVAPRDVADVVERAHTDAVADAVGWLEKHAAFTRLGAGGVRQVEVTGLLAVAFTHRDSRAGDPNLHTHVAVSNKVQVADTPGAAGQAGAWRALDGRPLHALAVAASERYNTRLEALLVDRLGVRFADRDSTGRGSSADLSGGKRAVREVVGVDLRLTRAWSARRADIDVRRAELAARFQADHGRPPTPVEALKLAQQATLETRQGKHAPRSHAEQRAGWRQQAESVLGGPHGLDRMLAAVRQTSAGRRALPREVTAGWVADTAQTVLETVQATRATWQAGHVRAETERRARAAGVPLALLDDAVERVVAAVLSPALSMPLGAPDRVMEAAGEPTVLRRSDGTSVYTRAGAQLFTSIAVLDAERALLGFAGRRDGRTASPAAVATALTEAAAGGVPLNAGQAALVHELSTSGLRVQLALAPAGTGKTTALAALAQAWAGGGGTVLGLAPSAAAAAVLGAELEHAATTREEGDVPGDSAGGGRSDATPVGSGRVPTDTLAKLLWSLDQLGEQPEPARDARSDRPAPGSPGAPGQVPAWVHDVGPGTLVLIDEAGMAGTVDLARAVSWVVGRGASVRLIGDTGQLSAVGAGGVLRDLTHAHGSVTLQQVLRFTDPAEAAASLALRDGDPTAIGFYLDHRRVHVGDPTTNAEQAYAAWQADRADGRDSLLLAPTRDLVTILNERARADRLGAQTADGQAPRAEVVLADGTAASPGDTILTRRNDRRLVVSGTDWVRNGDRWTVQRVLPGGALRAQHGRTGRHVLLPAAYVAEHVQLGYASTIHTAQGSTADTSHTVLTGLEDRQLLYVAATRGRTANHLYLQAGGDGDEHTLPRPDTARPATPAELLTRIVARDGAQTSATRTARQLADPSGRLADAADRYTDSISVAAREHFGDQRLATLEAAAERAVPGLTQAPAWPALRDQLVLAAATGRPPTATLLKAIGRRDLADAEDPAAVLSARLRETEPPQRRQGPLPWLPPVPLALSAHPLWGLYLTARGQQVQNLAEQATRQAHAWTPGTAPGWATPLLAATSARGEDGELVGQVALWRAAQRVPDSDPRPTGPPASGEPVVARQQQLDALVGRQLRTPTAGIGWARLLAAQPQLADDPNGLQLAARLAHVERRGVDVRLLLARCLQDGPLPDEQPAAALWWRLTRHLPPSALGPERPTTPAGAAPGTAADEAVPASAPTRGPTASERWTPLADSIDPRLTRCPGWPALAATLEKAQHAGYDVPAQLPGIATGVPLPEQHAAQELRYRLMSQCPAARTVVPLAVRLADDRERTAAARQRMADESRRADNAIERDGPATGTTTRAEHGRDPAWTPRPSAEPPVGRPSPARRGPAP